MDPTIDLTGYLGIPSGWLWLVVIIAIWSIAWMGVAMWKAARKKDLVWFVVFLLIHTVGILEILYIYIFSKMERKEAPVKARKRR